VGDYLVCLRDLAVEFNKRAKFLSVVLLLISLPFFIYTLGKVTGFWTQAFGTKANLVIDTGTSFEMGGMPWNNLAQGGEEKTRMLGSVILHLLHSVHQKAGAAYEVSLHLS